MKLLVETLVNYDKEFQNYVAGQREFSCREIEATLLLKETYVTFPATDRIASFFAKHTQERVEL